jgi:hypothetical protein
MAKRPFLANIALNSNVLAEGQLEDVGIETLSTAPVNPRENYVYFDTTKFAIGVYVGGSWRYHEPAIVKNTAFNKNFGTTAGTVTEGNDQRIVNSGIVWIWYDSYARGMLLTAETHMDNTVIHVTQADKDKWDYESEYTNLNPILVPLGGVQVGDTFSAISQANLFTKILYPDVAPKVTMTSTLPSGDYELGTSFVNVRLTAEVQKQTFPITGVNFMRNGSSINAPTFDPEGGSVSYQIPTVNSSGTILTRVIDGIFSTESNSYRYDFVRPIYIGGVPSNTTALTDAIITSLTKKIVSAKTIAESASLSDERLCICLANNFTLSSVRDSLGLELVNNFESQDVTIGVFGGGTAIYRCYMSTDISIDTILTIMYS